MHIRARPLTGNLELIFSITECKTLLRASKIAEQARELIARYGDTQDGDTDLEFADCEHSCENLANNKFIL